VRTRAAAALAGLASPDLTPRSAAPPGIQTPRSGPRRCRARRAPGGEAARDPAQALADSDASVRAAAVGGLAIRQDAEDRAALERRADGPSSRVRLRAAASLARQGQAARFPAKCSPSSAIRTSRCACRQPRPPDTWGAARRCRFLLGLLRDRNPYVQIYAAEASPAWGSRAAVTGLQRPCSTGSVRGDVRGGGLLQPRRR